MNIEKSAECKIQSSQNFTPFVGNFSKNVIVSSSATSSSDYSKISPENFIQQQQELLKNNKNLDKDLLLLPERNFKGMNKVIAKTVYIPSSNDSVMENVKDINLHCSENIDESINFSDGDYKESNNYVEPIISEVNSNPGSKLKPIAPNLNSLFNNITNFNKLNVLSLGNNNKNVSPFSSDITNPTLKQQTQPNNLIGLNAKEFQQLLLINNMSSHLQKTTQALQQQQQYLSPNLINNLLHANNNVQLRNVNISKSKTSLGPPSLSLNSHLGSVPPMTSIFTTTSAKPQQPFLNLNINLFPNLNTTSLGGGGQTAAISSNNNNSFPLILPNYSNDGSSNSNNNNNPYRNVVLPLKFPISNQDILNSVLLQQQNNNHHHHPLGSHHHHQLQQQNNNNNNLFLSTTNNINQLLLNQQTPRHNQQISKFLVSPTATPINIHNNHHMDKSIPLSENFQLSPYSFVVNNSNCGNYSHNNSLVASAKSDISFTTSTTAVGGGFLKPNSVVGASLLNSGIVIGNQSYNSSGNKIPSSSSSYLFYPPPPPHYQSPSLQLLYNNNNNNSSQQYHQQQQQQYPLLTSSCKQQQQYPLLTSSCKQQQQIAAANMNSTTTTTSGSLNIAANTITNTTTAVGTNYMLSPNSAINLLISSSTSRKKQPRKQNLNNLATLAKRGPAHQALLVGCQDDENISNTGGFNTSNKGMYSSSSIAANNSNNTNKLYQSHHYSSLLGSSAFATASYADDNCGSSSLFLDNGAGVNMGRSSMDVDDKNKYLFSNQTAGGLSDDRFMKSNNNSSSTNSMFLELNNNNNGSNVVNHHHHNRLSFLSSAKKIRKSNTPGARSSTPPSKKALLFSADYLAGGTDAADHRKDTSAATRSASSKLSSTKKLSNSPHQTARKRAAAIAVSSGTMVVKHNNINSYKDVEETGAKQLSRKSVSHHVHNHPNGLVKQNTVAIKGRRNKTLQQLDDNKSSASQQQQQQSKKRKYQQALSSSAFSRRFDEAKADEGELRGGNHVAKQINIANKQRPTKDSNVYSNNKKVKTTGTTTSSYYVDSEGVKWIIIEEDPYLSGLGCNYGRGPGMAAPHASGGAGTNKSSSHYPNYFNDPDGKILLPPGHFLKDEDISACIVSSNSCSTSSKMFGGDYSFTNNTALNSPYGGSSGTSFRTLLASGSASAAFSTNNSTIKNNDLLDLNSLDIALDTLLNSGNKTLNSSLSSSTLSKIQTPIVVPKSFADESIRRNDHKRIKSVTPISGDLLAPNARNGEIANCLIPPPYPALSWKITYLLAQLELIINSSLVQFNYICKLKERIYKLRILQTIFSTIQQSSGTSPSTTSVFASFDKFTQYFLPNSTPPPHLNPPNPLRRGDDLHVNHQQPNFQSTVLTSLMKSQKYTNNNSLKQHHRGKNKISLLSGNTFFNHRYFQYYVQHCDTDPNIKLFEKLIANLQRSQTFLSEITECKRKLSHNFTTVHEVLVRDGVLNLFHFTLNNYNTVASTLLLFGSAANLSLPPYNHPPTKNNNNALLNNNNVMESSSMEIGTIVNTSKKNTGNDLLTSSSPLQQLPPQLTISSSYNNYYKENNFGGNNYNNGTIIPLPNYFTLLVKKVFAHSATTTTGSAGNSLFLNKR